MGMVSAKAIATRPSGAGASDTTPLLEMAIRPSATTRVMLNTALKSGSSQHGKALRASVGSIWVVPMTRSTPCSSVNTER